MTGIRPRRSGLVANEGGLFFRKWEYNGEKPLDEATTLPSLLKNNGWYTAGTGKIFHGTNDLAKADGHRSWTDWTAVSGGSGAFVETPWSTLGWGTTGGLTGKVTNMNDYRAADFIARVLENGSASNEGTTFELPEDRPFFLACGIYKPHLPFVTIFYLI